jgi:dipeptidyl aminopeptidase/acylaminoacyl peptidase
MRRLFLAVGLAAVLVLILAACGGGGSKEEVGRSNGRIAFGQSDVSLGEPGTWTIEPDGSHMRVLFRRGSEFPHWSPDGGEAAVFCCDDGMAAHFVDQDGRGFHELAPPDAKLEVHCGFGWSPDGRRIACESFGVNDAKRDGIYSIRVSDGRGLTRITSNPGGDDIPGDYSPDGQRLVFVRSDPSQRVGIFTIGLDGRGLRLISPKNLVVDHEFGGRWSPSGKQILFVASTDESHQRAIWLVNADGSAPHMLPMKPACGGEMADSSSKSCSYPDWSPDGMKIVFVRNDANDTENIYVVDLDGTNLQRVTKSGGNEPDWGAAR